MSESAGPEKPRPDPAQLSGLMDLAMKQAVLQREERRQAMTFAMDLVRHNETSATASEVRDLARTFASFFSEG